MKSIFRTCMSLLLASVMVLSAVPLAAFSQTDGSDAFAGSLLGNATTTAATVAEGENTLYDGSDGVVTRAQWLHNLAVLFDMTVENGVYPDNYFSDLESTSEYYYDVLLNVEFGVLAIEAGGEVCPDDPCTRMFAAQSLHYCLGYRAEEEPTVSFTDAALCADQEAAQVALELGWFATVNGAFAPDTVITSREATAMIAHTRTVLAAQSIDENYDSSFVFADNVKVIPETTRTEIVAGEQTSEITVYNAPFAVEENMYFAVYDGGLPVVYQALRIREDGNDCPLPPTRIDRKRVFLKCISFE